MFGLGMGELIVIAIVALLFVGPDRLPQAAKTLSKGIRDFRKQTRELQSTLEDDQEIGGALRDLKSALRGDDFAFKYHEQRRKVAQALDPTRSPDDDDAGSAEDAPAAGSTGELLAKTPDPGPTTPPARPADSIGASGDPSDYVGTPPLTPAAGIVAQGEVSPSPSSTSGEGTGTGTGESLRAATSEPDKASHG